MTIAGTGTDVYCGAIYELAEDDIDTAQVQIASRLGVSRAAVSEMVERLRDEGLVAAESGRLQLTAAGRAVAERTVRRHRLAERFLVDVLELGWAAGVVPGAQICIVTIEPDGAVTVRGPRRTLQLPGVAALDLFVVEGDLAAISESITGRTARPMRSTGVSEEQ